MYNILMKKLVVWKFYGTGLAQVIFLKEQLSASRVDPTYHTISTAINETTYNNIIVIIPFAVFFVFYM